MVAPDFHLFGEAFHRRQDRFRIRQCPGLVGFPVPDHSLGVHNDHRAGSRPALLVPEVVCSGNLSFGMPVRQFRIGQPSHGCGPGPVGGNVVATDAQHLGIQLFELTVETAERSRLVRSTTGEIEDVERQHNRVRPAVSAE